MTLTIENLRIAAAGAVLVRDVSLTLEPYRTVTILGETGSGKTLVAEAAMGTVAPELAVSGRIADGGEISDAADQGARRGAWGRRIAMLPQEPWVSLDPTMRSLAQVAEGHRFVRGLGPGPARRQARADLASLNLAAGDDRYPHQLSGGMAQRVAFASARAGGAPITLADEPTKGLDATMRDAVVALLRKAVEEGGSLLCITHDIAVAKALGGEIIVMLKGEIVERGDADTVLVAPSHPYTRRLVAAAPENWPTATATPTASVPGDVVLEGTELAVSRNGRRLFSDLDLAVRAGEWIGVTGPSGCGKTTLGNVLLGLVPPASGRVRRRAGVASTRFQKLYQDPVATFSRHVSLRTALAETTARHRVSFDDVMTLLERLRVPEALLDRRPDQVSGGELQRVSLARVLIAKPIFLFADEPTSRLDPITQQETMDVMREVTRERGCGTLLVTHDRTMAERITERRITLGSDLA
ncbi:ABC transporter ATP-binding protein [Methylobacterium indicum]|uniref:ABC transporter ATP-binding protein n=1 Tax=Methylobacterium indicum TaxID=1775910 RepID=UPI002434ED4D|nr:ATP-binding cassette domain-containing protein [Methylobacterium indicum]